MERDSELLFSKCTGGISGKEKKNKIISEILYRFLFSGNPTNTEKPMVFFIKLVEVNDMKSRQRTLRIMLSGILLMATLACGVYVYRYESNKKEEAWIESAKEEEENELDKTVESSEEEAADANTSNAQAEMSEYEQSDVPQNVTETPTETPAEEQQQPQETPALDADADTTASDAVLPALDFNEGTLLSLPLSGETVIPYNMDNTVYFSTLDLYRCNPAVMIAAEIDTPVAVVANSQVASITEDAVTGTTVTMDMGNGYQAVYGQLKDVNVEQGQTVASGTVIGSVNAPTKYFTKEGSNLYFALSKDGTPLDPALYLPPETE